jgi:type I restriction enzyme R subunit
MTEFKQIVGRGTRIREADGKVYFTIMDFRKATNLFADPDFDGDPVVIYEPDEGETPVPPEDNAKTSFNQPPVSLGKKPNIDIQDNPEEVKKYYINNVQVTVASERVQYYGKDGKLITESLKKYSKDNIIKEYSSIDSFLNTWNNTSKKEVLLSEMAEHGILLEALREEVGQDLDAFDLICHTAFDMPPLTRKERAENVKKRNYFAKYGEQARKVLEGLLDKYVQDGVVSIEDAAVLKLKPLSDLGGPVELVRAFGKKADYDKAVKELEQEIYKIAY